MATKPDLTGVVLHPAKAELRPTGSPNRDAGKCLEAARGVILLDEKEMAATMGISYSLLMRGLETGDLNFRRLWALDNRYWRELMFTAAKVRCIGVIRRTLDLEQSA